MNSKNYKAYANMVNRKPVLIDGTTLLHILLMYSYNRKMFNNFFSNGEKYYVPDFSYDKAYKSILTENQGLLISGILKELPEGCYEVVKTDSSEPSAFGEEADFVIFAMKFLKNHPTATMRVSSSRIWEIMRTTYIQEMRDELDLL